MILVYPVITMGEKGHGGSRTNLLGKQPDDEAGEAVLEREAGDGEDPARVPGPREGRQGGACRRTARCSTTPCKAQKVPSKYLELPSGGHGLNGYKGPMWDAWQTQSLAWLGEQKFIPAGGEKK